MGKLDNRLITILALAGAVIVTPFKAESERKKSPQPEGLGAKLWMEASGQWLVASDRSPV